MSTPPLTDAQHEALERLYRSPMWAALEDAEREAECRDCNDGVCIRCKP